MMIRSRISAAFRGGGPLGSEILITTDEKEVLGVSEPPGWVHVREVEEEIVH